MIGAVLNRVDLEKNPYYYSAYYRKESSRYYQQASRPSQQARGAAGRAQPRLREGAGPSGPALLVSALVRRDFGSLVRLPPSAAERSIPRSLAPPGRLQHPCRARAPGARRPPVVVDPAGGAHEDRSGAADGVEPVAFMNEPRRRPLPVIGRSCCAPVASQRLRSAGWSRACAARHRR